MTDFDRKTVSKFIIAISEEYEGIDIEELEEKFNKLCKPKKKVTIKNPEVEEIPKKELTEQDLVSLTVVQLKELCKARKLKVSGKKDELKARLLGKEVATVPKKKSDEKTGYKTPARITTKHLKKEKNADVIKKLESIQSKQPIRRNAQGLLVHPETNLIFSEEEDPVKKTRLVIGVVKDGEKSMLTAENINTCKQYKFEYILPDNLASEKDEGIDIDELDGEEDIENIIEKDIEEEEEDIEEELEA